MKDQINTKRASINKHYLTTRFCIAALLMTGLLVSAMMVVSYFQMRKQNLELTLAHVAEDVNSYPGISASAINLTNDPILLGNLWQFVRQSTNASEGTFYDLNLNVVWASGETSKPLNIEEKALLAQIGDGLFTSKILDRYKLRLTGSNDFFGKRSQPIVGLLGIRNIEGKTVGFIKLSGRFSRVIVSIERALHRMFWFILGGNLLLFFALFYNFMAGLKIIEGQEKELNQQILKLSELLLNHKDVRKSMKTASSRAVELNEQFLRRVGSDLHDGPAQSMGFAILRLDKISKTEAARNLNHEFHVVKEAMESALEEVRGISSGLVLPELEDLTLEQALRKVVLRHKHTSETEVTQYYTDLPAQIPLPIKICAYRFVQEGLNNAHRHGRAAKCRVTAYVKDDVLHLTLKDNGMGFRKSQLSSDGGHLGLMGLKDRIESLGGRFSINSELGVGTAIKVSVSLTDDV